MSDASNAVRRPLHLVWDAPIVASIAAVNPEWGTLPCPLDGQANRTHAWIRHEVSYDDTGQMDGLTVVACAHVPHPPDPEPLVELRACIRNGKTPEDVNRVLEDVFGLRLVCVWEFADALGFGGSSEFYVQRDGRTFELAGNLWGWLTLEPGTPDAPDDPGTPGSWVGAPVGVECAYEDGYKQAIRDRR
ncbi:hypothetical protein ABZT26_36055 [Streptomyces sp. NPDC005395]|uniref:hypothetical protein n=1 Tax=Streptomyces sp. NPDC005395 TaxID=3157042 RepID=UPI0033A67634